MGFLLAACQYLQGGCQEYGARLFTVVNGKRTRDNRHMLKQKRFRADKKKSFFSMRTVRQWSRLPREFVQSPSLEVFKP